VLDVGLADMRGDGVLAQMRVNARSADVPVVSSANAMASQIERVMALGATRYVTKPFDVVAPLDLLDAVVGGERSETDVTIKRVDEAWGRA
jgi:CheY-like chemotaxis protein